MRVGLGLLFITAETVTFFSKFVEIRSCKPFEVPVVGAGLDDAGKGAKARASPSPCPRPVNTPTPPPDDRRCDAMLAAPAYPLQRADVCLPLELSARRLFSPGALSTERRRRIIGLKDLHAVAPR